MYIIEIICGELTAPDHGMITCSLGEDDIPTYQDTCNYACNDGYHLNGSTTRECSDHDRWSGSEPVCIKSMSRLNRDIALVPTKAII